MIWDATLPYLCNKLIYIDSKVFDTHLKKLRERTSTFSCLFDFMPANPSSWHGYKKKVLTSTEYPFPLPNMNYYLTALRVTGRPGCIFLFSSATIQINDSSRCNVNDDSTLYQQQLTQATACQPSPNKLLGAALRNQIGGQICCPAALD